jgi:hypothetical protein
VLYHRAHRLERALLGVARGAGVAEDVVGDPVDVLVVALDDRGVLVELRRATPRRFFEYESCVTSTNRSGMPTSRSSRIAAASAASAACTLVMPCVSMPMASAMSAKRW